MFYCVYCEKDKEDSLGDIHYKQSIKCAQCAQNFANRKSHYTINCECGITLKSTGRMRHLASVVHKRYLTSLCDAKQILSNVL
jgi:hypothetical protein